MQSTSNISNINQHILCFCSDEIYRLLEEESAIVYVCGDAKGMARDVTQAFVSIIAEKKGVYKFIYLTIQSRIFPLGVDH